jgi:hypothetical protein
MAGGLGPGKPHWEVAMETLRAEELLSLVRSVFAPVPADRALAILVDLPDLEVPDNPAWLDRREMALGWAAELASVKGELGLNVHLYLYRNVRRNNADLPPAARAHRFGPLPATADELDATAMEPFESIFAGHGLLVALTEFSATAPLKLAAPRHGFRAATMPGFTAAMIPALRLDYDEINRRVERLKALLDEAEAAELLFRVDGDQEHRLRLDLRFRTAHASGGRFPSPGTAGNLPSGEAYIVPYEGERPGNPSGSAGMLPVQFDDEIVLYRIEGNRAVAVLGENPACERERALLAREPAYGNLAELGLGVLAELGVRPCGEALLDEKLGLHIAFGRSDHFGGQVGAADFSRPEAVVHIDRVFIPETQPRVSVVSLELLLPSGRHPLIANDKYIISSGLTSART